MNTLPTKTPSQKKRLLEYLESGKSLFRLDAWEKLGILEAPARITELRQDGHNIKTTMRTVKNRFGDAVRVAEWRLIK